MCEELADAEFALSKVPETPPAPRKARRVEWQELGDQLVAEIGAALREKQRVKPSRSVIVTTPFRTDREGSNGSSVCQSSLQIAILLVPALLFGNVPGPRTRMNSPSNCRTRSPRWPDCATGPRDPDTGPDGLGFRTGITFLFPKK